MSKTYSLFGVLAMGFMDAEIANLERINTDTKAAIDRAKIEGHIVADWAPSLVRVEFNDRDLPVNTIGLSMAKQMIENGEADKIELRVEAAELHGHSDLEREIKDRVSDSMVMSPALIAEI